MESSGRSSSVVPFPAASPAGGPAGATVTAFSPVLCAAGAASEAALSVRLAVYETDRSHPAVYDVTAADPGALLAELASRTLWWLARRTSPLPREAVLAVVENLIHAHFLGATVAVLPDGSVQVSDRGPGIADKERALRTGFSTATAEMRRYIRGVGSGLPVALRLMQSIGGQLVLDDNLAGGTVVSLWTPRAVRDVRPPAPAGAARGLSPVSASAGGEAVGQQPLFAPGPAMRLSPRQLRILCFLARHGPAGPSQVARQLSLSLTTAFRELTALEGLGLARTEPGGKRRLTPAGLNLAEAGPLDEPGGHAPPHATA